jgi:two-component system, NarL family, sensor histidine kinase UhpB
MTHESGTQDDKGVVVDTGQAMALYRLLAENAREMVSRHAFDLTFLYASPAASRVLGVPAGDLIGQRLDDLVHPDDLGGLVSTFALARDGRDTISIEFRIRAGDQSWRWCEAFARGVENPDSGELEIHAAIHDISKYKQIEKAIERVAKEWRGTFDSARDAILMLDRQARVVRVNLATTRFLDCAFSDLLGRPLAQILHDRLGLEDPLGIDEAWVDGEQVRRDFVLADNQTWLRSTIDPVLDGSGKMNGAVVFLSDVSSEKHSGIRLQETLLQLRRLSSHLQSVREEERKSIAREVHDELGHALTALKMDVAWLVKQVPSGSETLVARARGMAELIDQTISTVRRISTALRPPVLDDLGLDAALEWLAGDFQGRTDIQTRVELPDDPQRLRGNRASTLFRIVQEALTNVARHANASEIVIGWKQTESDIELSIADDGDGFERTKKSPGFGLLGMTERARDLDGHLEISSSPGGGTVVRVEFPRHLPT